MTTRSETLPDFYAVLGVPDSATPEQIRRRYRFLAREYHTDVTDYPKPWAEEQMKALNLAYEVLSDPDKKAAYDEERRRRATPVEAPPPPRPAPRRRAPPRPNTAAPQPSSRQAPQPTARSRIDFLCAATSAIVMAVAAAGPLLLVTPWRSETSPEQLQEQVTGLMLGVALIGFLAGGSQRLVSRVVADSETFIHRAIGGASLAAVLCLALATQLSQPQPSTLTFTIASAGAATTGALLTLLTSLRPINRFASLGRLGSGTPVRDSIHGSLTVAVAAILVLEIAGDNSASILMTGLGLGALGLGVGTVSGVTARLLLGWFSGGSDPLYRRY